MTNINIEINDETYKKFKSKCADNGTLIKDAVINLIEGYVNSKTEKVEE